MNKAKHRYQCQISFRLDDKFNINMRFGNYAASISTLHESQNNMIEKYTLNHF